MSENLQPNETENVAEQETIVIENAPTISVAPKNRPRKVYGGMWGVPEIIAVGLGTLAILGAILLFAFLVLPRQKELQNNRAKRDELEQKLISEDRKYGSITTIEKRVAELISSVDDFETRFLKPSLIGKGAIYQQINGLISAYGLTNTTGPDYAVLEINNGSNNGQQAEKESGRAKFQSLFPGDYVTMTVEGSYPNLRRFIAEIERSNQFIVISAIELEPSDTEEKKKLEQTIAQQQQNQQPTDTGKINFQNPTNQAQATPKPKIPQGKTRGEIVSLRLEMAAYYRRPNFVPMAEKVSGEK